MSPGLVMQPGLAALSTPGRLHGQGQSRTPSLGSGQLPGPWVWSVTTERKSDPGSLGRDRTHVAQGAVTVREG